MERHHFLVTSVTARNILRFICVDRVRFAIGGGDSGNGHTNIDKYAGSDVVVEYHT